MNRDYQRSRVYSAEQRIRWLLDTVGDDRTVNAYGSTWYLPQDARFANVSDIQRYVDRVLQVPHVQQVYSRAALPVRVRARKGATKAHYSLGEIAIPGQAIGGRWALREVVVLHEVAHHLAPVAEQHGPAFCRTFLDLLQSTGQDSTAALLEIAFAEEGVNLIG